MVTADKMLEVISKIKFNTAVDSKKLDDDELMDYIDWLENNPPADSNKDAHKSALLKARKELQSRGYEISDNKK